MTPQNSQDFDAKTLKKIMREGDIMSVPLDKLTDFSELSPKEFVSFIKESVSYRKRTIKRFKAESERTLQQHMRLPPSLRKRKRKNGQRTAQS